MIGPLVFRKPAIMIAVAVTITMFSGLVEMAKAHPPMGEMSHTSNGAEADAPGNHGMFMVGSETLFCCICRCLRRKSICTRWFCAHV